MPTIKGPIVVGKNTGVDFIGSNGIKLPFTATGMVVENNQELIDKLGYGPKSAVAKKKPVKRTVKATKRRK